MDDLSKYPDVEFNDTLLSLNLDYDESEMFDNFDKSEFEIYESIDQYLKEFLTELNKNPNIMSTHSCEGHDGGSSDGYIAFKVNAIGWNTFWCKVVPNILKMPGITVNHYHWKDAIDSHICVRIKLDAYRDVRWDYVFKIFAQYFKPFSIL